MDCPLTLQPMRGQNGTVRPRRRRRVHHESHTIRARSGQEYLPTAWSRRTWQHRRSEARNPQQTPRDGGAAGICQDSPQNFTWPRPEVLQGLFAPLHLVSGKKFGARPDRSPEGALWILASPGDAVAPWCVQEEAKRVSASVSSCLKDDRQLQIFAINEVAILQ